MGDRGTSAPKRSGVLGALLWMFGGMLVLVAAAGAYGLGYVSSAFEQPGPASEAVIVDLPRGSGLNSIAARLEGAGAISNGLIFRAVVRVQGQERDLKAGEYEIAARSSMREVLQQLTEGRVIEHSITAAEGLTSQMIVELLNASTVLTGEIEALPPEGSLLPETYQITRGDTRQSVLNRMADAQDDVIAELWDERAPGLPFTTVEEALILASIVEKETGLASERERVAAVFVNRMNRGMRMETDPTIIYGITKGYPLGRGIRRSELDDDTNPYNTYKIRGLPPTPICNPGREAIAAVLNPAETSDLYFVADGTGGHAFAVNYAQHQQNVAAWRRVERARASQ